MIASIYEYEDHYGETEDERYVILYKKTGDKCESKKIRGYEAESFFGGDQTRIANYYNSLPEEEIENILLEDENALIEHFALSWGGGLPWAIAVAKQQCRDLANDDNDGLVDEALVRHVRGSL
jgi:hypothetical protein